jgi:ribose/xylose/arabinose/galactoside ABC-type transport system permease subunit
MEVKKKTTEGKRRKLNQSLVLALMIVGLCIIATAVNPRFIRITNLINILQQISVLGIIASGVGMLLIAGEIDISVGSMVSLMGIVLAMILEKSGAIPPDAPNAWMTNWAVPLTIVVTFILGALCGFINGITVIKSRAASFIITLGFGSVYKGIALLVSGGASFSLYGRFEALGRGRILDVLPISILFLFGIVVLTHVLLKYSKYGRFLYSIGGNRKAAFVSGINTTRVTLRGFIMVGVFNALAALILISRTGTALATTAEAYSLDALASVVVGGVAITGGKGNAFSIFLGVLLIGLVSNALVVMNVNPYMRGVAIGLIIIIAVTVSGLSEQRK